MGEGTGPVGFASLPALTPIWFPREFVAKWVLSRCLMSCVVGSKTRGWGITEQCNDHKKQLWAANELSPALSCLECAHELGVHRTSLYSRAGRRIDLDRGW